MVRTPILPPDMRRPSFISRSAMAAALACALGCAYAAPDERNTSGGDAVLQLLQDKGLLPRDAQTDGRALVQQVRDTASELVISAMNFIGVPYRRGGSDEGTGFDCSGFTRHVFEHSLGLVLPRRADEQARADGLSKVGREELKPGDLVFFNTLRHTFSHVGIYVGEGKFIHAPRSGSEVRIEDMRKAYWDRRFTGARRVDGVGTVALPAAEAGTPPLR
jgi:cell wall-associated NlpC family hydrolase